MDVNNFQRLGSLSNAHAGNDFEEIARNFFLGQGLSLERNFIAPVGVGSKRKDHKIDLGSEYPPVLVECKSHTWTRGDNMPSAKLTVWNEAMYYFHLAPSEFRKIFFVQRDCREDISLASYYLDKYGHMIPPDVELWEYCLDTDGCDRLF